MYSFCELFVTHSFDYLCVCVYICLSMYVNLHEVKPNSLLDLIERKGTYTCRCIDRSICMYTHTKVSYFIVIIHICKVIGRVFGRVSPCRAAARTGCAPAAPPAHTDSGRTP
jgi:hypothetical protein